MSSVGLRSLELVEVDTGPLSGRLDQVLHFPSMQADCGRVLGKAGQSAEGCERECFGKIAQPIDRAGHGDTRFRDGSSSFFSMASATRSAMAATVAGS